VGDRDPGVNEPSSLASGRAGAPYPRAFTHHQEGVHCMPQIEVGLGCDGIGTVVLNRPEKRNALSRAMCLELAAGVRQLGEDPTCAGIVLSARGAAFSSGADTSEPSHDLPATWHWD